MKRIAGPILLALMLMIFFSVPVFGAQAPSVGAAGAVVIDYETGEIYYEKNGDTARPIASMTKVMSIYLVFEAIENGELSLDSMVTASSYAAKVSANKNYSGHEGLVAGNQYKVDDLLRVILTASANGSVIVLAEAISGSESAFVQKMNAKAQEMGITAHFADCCGLVSNGNAVTPRAMAQLAVNLIRDYPEVLKYTSLKSTSFNGKTFNSTNSLLKNNSVAGIDGLKTGTTSAAGYCYTATASQNDRRIIAVVMKATSSAARFTDAKAMLEYGFATRAEREVQWAQAEKMEWAITYSPSKVLPLQPVTLTASVSNIDADVSIPCSEKWLLNGSPVAETEKDISLTSDTTSTFTYTPSMQEKEVKVTYQLRFPGGDIYTAEEIVPVADPPTETYTVVWLDDDDTVLEVDRKLSYGTMPSYDGPQP
ncbi:MAG: serine hydrolase [Firmicutes bacterium]|nr:serine hydrolase [Bacillota bacterium]